MTVTNSTEGGPQGYDAANLFDGNYGSEWHTNQRVSGNYFVEFKCQKPVSPLSYFVFSGTDSGTHWNRTPQAWKLFGKANEGDEWIELSNYDTSRDGYAAWIPGENMKRSNTFGFNVQKPHSLQYFRLEISRDYGAGAIQLNELVFVY